MKVMVQRLIAFVMVAAAGSSSWTNLFGLLPSREEATGQEAADGSNHYELGELPAPEFVYEARKFIHEDVDNALVSVGDLHGDYGQMIKTLKLLGVVHQVPAELQPPDGVRWSLGAGTFVQTGDITDRGPDTKRMIDLMIDLSDQAAQAGGRVIHLLGNHETANLSQYYGWVHPQEYEDYGGREAREAEFSAEGRHGAYLRGLDGVAMVERTLYAHAGVLPHLAELGLSAINDIVHAALNQTHTLSQVQNRRRMLQGRARRKGLTLAEVYGEDSEEGQALHRIGEVFDSEAGIFWTRAFDTKWGIGDKEQCGKLGRTLTLLGADRMVIGHNVLQGEPRVRCGNRLFSMDTGIAQYYGGFPSGLVLTRRGGEPPRVQVVVGPASVEAAHDEL